MASSVEIRALLADDDRSDFSCGQPDLDRFFEHYAGPNQFELHLGVSYVAVVRERIVGFATVTVGALERERLLDAKMRRRLPRYPLPIVRLARLGVDLRAQGVGVGTALVRHVLALAASQRDAVGCVGVVTDAKPDAVRFYASLGFVALGEPREGGLHGDTTPMFLAMSAITAAIE